MWLLTAVGAVHGQNHFTFVLEQNKTYTIGREKGCEIRFDSRSVRMKEGVLEVGDWDPTNHKKPPVLTFKVEPKKNGAFPSYKMMTPYENAVGSLNKEEYVCDELEHQGLYFENPGQGVELGPETWFFAQWVDMVILYEKIKDTEEEIRETMRRYCIAWQADFSEARHPTLVLSPAYKSNQPCNYAVCYGIRILTPEYLTALLAKIDASWKKVADSQDSFSMPDELAPEYTPTLDPKLPNTRTDVGLWSPDPSRKELFRGWKVLGLRTDKPPAERRWITSMGAQWSEVDIVTTPLLSSKDFMDRISSWVQEVEQSGDKERAVIAHFVGVKESVLKAGKDWNTVVTSTCQSLGIWLSSGNICWASVKLGSVQEYLEGASGGARPATYVGTAEPTAPAVTARRSPEKSRPTRAEPAPEPILPDPSPQVPKIPSTYPDESAMEAGPSTTTQAAGKAMSPEIGIPPPTASASRKPLKRRAGKQTVSDLFDMDLDPSPSTDATPPDSLEPIKEDLLPLPSAGQGVTNTQSIMPPPTQSTSRLKRRAGQATQTSTFDLFGETEQPSIKTEETSQEIRELYEATKRGDQHPSLKRARVVSAESARGTTDEDSLSSDIMPAELPTRETRMREVEIADGADGDVGMPEEGEEEDFVQKTLKRVAASRRAGRTQTTQATQNDSRAMPPPSLPMTHRRLRSPSEETEEVESSKRPRLASPEKTAKMKSKSTKKGKESTEDTERTNNEPTTDPAFLLAVAKSRSKKAIDEMDKEFNNLKIPKSAIRGKGRSQAQSLNQVDMDNLPPDYGILNDFGDEMRGNFIQVIRKDLFRKDGGAKVVERADDGRPNFKKFKKKEIIRRDPVPLVLVSRNTEDDEMGEPYWPDPTGRSGNRMTQPSQTLTGESEDSLPLLPRSRQRRLLTQQEDHDDPAPLSLSSTNRRRGNNADSQSATQQAASRTTQRKTRAASIASEADSVASTSTRGTRSTTTTTTARGENSRTKKQPALLEDSEEEEGVKFTPSNSGLDRTGTRLGSTNGGNTASTRRRGTQDEPPPTATASASVSAASRAARSGQPSSSVTVGRRKLLSIDDDDEGELVFKAAAKKRRLG